MPSPESATIYPQKNTVGLIALITAVLGAIFACIPGALIVGWVLLPVAFILAIVALCLRGRKKTTGIVALIVSVVGTIIGFIVFFGVVATAIDDSFSSDITATVPEDQEDQANQSDQQDPAVVEADTASDDAAAAEDSAAADDAEQGTRANPYPLGTDVSDGEWTITINSVDLDATEAVLAENPFNDEPAADHVYLLANVTAEYTGSDADGAMPWLSLSYVSPGGNSFDASDALAVAPEAFDSTTTLFEGASETGNIALQVPADSVGDGVLTFTPGLFGSPVYVAVQ